MTAWPDSLNFQRIEGCGHSNLLLLQTSKHRDRQIGHYSLEKSYYLLNIVGDWLLQVMNIATALWVEQVICYIAELGFSHWCCMLVLFFWRSSCLLSVCSVAGEGYWKIWTNISWKWGWSPGEFVGHRLQIFIIRMLTARKRIAADTRTSPIGSAGLPSSEVTRLHPYMYTSLVTIFLLNGVDDMSSEGCDLHGGVVYLKKMSLQDASWHVLTRSSE